eukprot:TRINITY_DN912_c0_g1_i1.p1 TRINITY_DN912_c0_g1~~TRINITY_DN912_c0_g1_i1.p1  ORF type:complete len:230 (-),score=63.16 TRINITY_DN912_c0_g1_i1:170-859(-)
MSSANLISGSKLTYFDFTGRAEAIRLALKIGSVEFSEERLAFQDWPAVKPSTPWGSLPFLTLSDGSVLGQQRAILRLIGRSTNLYPEDPLQAARVDELMDAADDIINTVNNAGRGLETEAKLAARTEAAAPGGVAGLAFDTVESFIVTHGSNGHSVGDQLTLADLMTFQVASLVCCGFFDGVGGEVLERYPHIQACRKLVGNVPAVVEHYDSRGELGEVEAFFKAARNL